MEPGNDIGWAVWMMRDGKRVQDIVDDLAQATQREARLREVLREAVQCFCVTQKPADYPVDSWINKALTELRRPEEAGT